MLDYLEMSFGGENAHAQEFIYQRFDSCNK